MVWKVIGGILLILLVIGVVGTILKHIVGLALLAALVVGGAAAISWAKNKKQIGR